MGIPQTAASDAPPETPHITAGGASASREQSPSSAAPRASSLPPAAIQLAGQIFDLARNGSTEALGRYVEAGIPPNLTNHKGDTLLMLAAYHGHADVVRMLLGKGADPNVLNDRGQSIIAGAVFKNYEDVVRLLYEGQGGKPADIWLGQPNAVDSAKMFKQEKYLNLFGVEDDGIPPWEAAAASRT
ncbi:hypothetical protein ANO11243_020680 [Dothideomycetidae sp. 11243]|nr:hypothetical protein ANO11243_020680 [fungal sp. No.11243]